MANEFKIKKGLIVTGASGGTVVDIQGSQGQLFSVTDDLSGSIFAVSDISGVPILDVNSSGLSTFDGDVNLPDNKKILLGTGNDLQIYHDGSNSYIKDTGTGSLIIQSSDLFLRTNSTENAIVCAANASVTLYYNNVSKLATTSTGVTVTGMVTVNGGGVDIDNDDNIRLRFDNASTFKAGLQVATTAGDMIAGSAIDDFAIRAQENMLFSSGGNVEVLKLDTSGNATFAGNVAMVQTSGSNTLTIDSSGGGNPVIYFKDPTRTWGQFVAGGDLYLKNETTNVVALLLSSSNATFAGTATATSFTTSTDSGINLNGITLTRVAVNSAVRVSQGLETLGLLRSYAGLNVGTSATIGSSTQGNTLTISSVQGSRNTRFLSAGNGGYVQYESANDGIYGYIGSGSHLLSPVVNDNDFVLRAQGEFAVSIGATEKMRINSSGGVSFAGTVTAPTFQGDLNGTINTVTTAVTKLNATNDTTVATTAFVQNLIGTIPAGLVFQGTWDAATNTPTLTSGSGTTGNFYIVSTSGSTNLDGVTDWVTGDWAVFIEQGGTDAWEKIDNSSVLDGAGTGQSVTKWDGSGTSNTLTDGPITFSTNDSTFAGTITSADDVEIRSGNKLVLQRPNNAIATEISTDVAGTMILNSVNDEGFKLQNSGVTILEIGNLQPTAANFAGDVSLGGNLTLTTNARYLRAEDSAGTTTRLLGINSANITYIGPIDAYAGGDIFYGVSAGVSNQVFYTGASERMRITSGGNVGIGTTNPDQKLHLHNGTLLIDSGAGISTGIWMPDVNGNPSLRIVTDQSAASHSSIVNAWGNSSNAGIMLGTTRNDGFAFQVRSGVTLTDGFANDTGNSRMVVLGNGDVGIGTTSPGNKLHVEGAGGGSAISYFNNTTTAGYGVLIKTLDTSNGRYGLQVHTGGDSSALYVANSGSVGIGTSNASSKLQVAGGIQMADDTDAAVADKAGTMRYRTDTEYVEVDGINLDVLPAVGGTPDAYLLGAYGNNTVTYANQISTLTFVNNSGGGYHYFNTTTNMSSAAVANSYYTAKITFKVNTGTIQWHLYTGSAYINSEVSSGTGYQTMEITFQAISASNIFIKTINMSTGQVIDISLCEIFEVTAEDASYADMCMQTGATTYEWVNIVRNTY